MNYHREIWAVWREALHLLVNPANAEMTGFTATGPRVPEKPWDWTREVIGEKAG